VSNNRYLPNQSIVLPGSEIFNLFFEGTKFNGDDERGNSIEKNLQTNWFQLEHYFNNALNDITETTSDRVKSQLENWFEVLKKVMRMWTSNSDLVQTIKAGATKAKGPKSNSSAHSGASAAANGNIASSDADDFYVFLYDEEDKTNTQTTINKSGRGRGFNRSVQTQRVLGFWCFNAGVGFKQIQSLGPRSIILTSGTLSPLPSFEAEL